MKKEGEIKFLTSKVKQLNNDLQKIKSERDELQKINELSNMTLDKEICNILKDKVCS